MKTFLLAALSALAVAAPALALAQDGPLAMPAPASPPIPAPRDVAYPGVIKIAVDATDLDRRIFNVRETVPVSGPGRLTMLYPRWLPGNHSPSGPIDKFAGLIVTAGGKRLEWTRDPVTVTAFHIDVPAGVSSVDLQFQYLSPTAGDQGRIVVTPEMMSVQWNLMSLYPAGYFVRRIMIQPSIKLPEGWTFATALDGAQTTGQETTFAPTAYDVFMDSPMLAGRYGRKIDLDPGGRSRVTLDVFADSPDLLEATPAQIDIHRALVQQADRLFGARHYNHYDFLFSITDRLGGVGLEHHRSSEDGSAPTYFTEWDRHAASRDLLAHEYTHSWNGKYRRGQDLWTPNYDVPMRDSLLWVYEGQTQYWGYVLAARSGLLTKQEALDAIAATAATYDNRVGREWKALIDTTNDPITASRKPIPWTSWQRSEDYYSEGELIWLDADTLIREKTGGKKSLDDFAKAFFGVHDGSYTELTYTFDDVVAALNGVVVYDWADFLKARLESHGPGAPLDGLARGGYRLVYTDKPTGYWRSSEMKRKATDLTYSLGFSINKDGNLTAVQWGGPAFQNGLTVGTQIVAVNGIAYDVERLKTAITNARTGKEPIEVIVKSADHYRTVRIDYHGGLRYPHLERIDAKAPARLDAILAAK